MSRFGLAVLALAVAILAANAGEAPTPNPKGNSQAPALTEKLAQEVSFSGVDDPKTTLAEVLAQLQLKYAVQFDVNEVTFRRDLSMPEVLKTEIANPQAIPPMKATLKMVLKKILSRVASPEGRYEATYVIRDNVIEITTMQSVAKEFYRGRADDDNLPPLVFARFENRPVTDALKELARSTDGNIILDPRARDKEGKAPTVTCELKNVPLDTAIRLIADMAGLKMVQLDAVYYVTTSENAEVFQHKHKQARIKKRGGLSLHGTHPTAPQVPTKPDANKEKLQKP